MHHSSSIKKTVRQLRIKGFGLNDIRMQTHLSLSTIHSWVRDIKLNSEQSSFLRLRSQKALQEGRVRAQAFARARRQTMIDQLFQKGKKDIKFLSKREMFIAGIALYWAEGFKNEHERRLGFCNSDPSMIKFYIQWLKTCLGIEKNIIVARVSLNKSYKSKTDEIQKYWSRVTKIPLTQFTKPFYQDSKWKKQYKTENYHGVLRLHVKDSLNYLLRMRGWIEGLKFDRISNSLPG